jgi:hypothetical protein
MPRFGLTVSVLVIPVEGGEHSADLGQPTRSTRRMPKARNGNAPPVAPDSLDRRGNRARTGEAEPPPET